MDFQEIPVSAELQHFDAYTPGEQPQENDLPLIKLNTNENPFPAAKAVLTALQDFKAEQLRLYPDPSCLELRKAAAAALHLPAENLVFANGSDELLGAVFRAYLTKSDSLALCRPSYKAYQTYAHLYNIPIFWLDVDTAFHFNAKQLRQSSAKVCFLANPHSPSGTAMSSQQLLGIFKENPKKLFVVDEAYGDFFGDCLYTIATSCHNLLVIRTLSKSFSLAGLRLGYAVANVKIIQWMRKVLDPYNVNALTQALGKVAFQNFSAMQESCMQIKQIRKKFAKNLQSLGFSLPHSEANFILCKPPNSWQKLGYLTKSHSAAAAVFKLLREQNILVRYFNEPGLHTSIRISIGLEQHMQQVFHVLKKIQATSKL